MNKRFHNPEDSKRYEDWLDRAGDDMLSAELLLNDERCYLSCAFHCQQAIEKALKAYILIQTDNLMDGHSLSWLCRQALKHDMQFEPWIAPCAVLNKYYIETRYPTDIPFSFTFAQAERAYQLACELYIFICSKADEYLDLTD